MKANALFALLLLLLQLLSCHAEELQILLSVRSSINDPLHSLATWNNTSAFCNWEGLTCSSSSRHVSAVQLAGRNLSGDLPSALLSLSFVASIDLSSNSFSGAIPPDAFAGLSPSLLFLNLSNNNLSGALHFPSGEDGGGGRTLFSLQVLDLSNNFLAGPIPDEISRFVSLKDLDLGGNYFQGRIPLSIAELKGLQFLTLASNELIGPIPTQLGDLTALQWVYLGYNNLSGEIPAAIGNLTALGHLDLVYNHLAGGIPSSIGNLPFLQYLFVYKNQLSGSIPPSVYNLTALISLDLSENQLEGKVSENVMRLENLEVLNLFSNRLSGPIPGSLGATPRLRVLQLWSNRFEGTIPGSLGLGNDELAVVDLSSNNLTGRIPEHLCYALSLVKLILFSNAFTGGIPRGLTRCRTLERVRIEDNRLSGEIPLEFTRLPAVNYLDVSGNQFSGEIGRRRWEMMSLRMLSLSGNRFSGPLPNFYGGYGIEHLDLSENQFSGSIPQRYGRFAELSEFNLSGNRLSGSVPGSIVELKRLVRLDLSKNHLSGEIPSGAADLPVLSALDLSVNDFSGEIPPGLGKSGLLVSINVSYNSFQGSVPQTEAFLSVGSTALAGNPGLCGGGPKSGLPACEEAAGRPPWWFPVSVLAAALLIIFLSVVLAFLLRRWWRSREFELKKVETVGDCTWEVRIFRKTSLTTEDILASVKNSKSETCDGKLVTVKAAGEVPWLGWAEVTESGRLRHCNVVGLIAACRSDTTWVFLYEPLTGIKSLGDAKTALSWEKRRRVAFGVAKGLCYVHHRGRSGMLTATDVVLDDDGEPRLVLNVANLSPGEFKERETSDVYFYGMLLVELLTGRRDVDGDEQGVLQWARYCYRERHLDEWVDPAMRGQVECHRDEMIGVMDLAIRCVAAEAAERPPMTKVVKILLELQRKTFPWLSKVKSAVKMF
ncbi:leucine-rich repeat receptor-like serine/threonine-protein kinase SKM1 isoform X1 [Zingiber officinale]|uniref:Leucine-rich repeat-containing N-terminal plant-type domain-containing protein n=1 Tax=Zingiber officinale TaxID=94328 RepID=A0A8J5L292_ZINOF|nr:leucine-rich repeat receptor-like serine/threonine-protein kinase SKM1 isoform X1 [Zingiber officinale]KAG6498656.1 hypothetical protein ZIOFF_038377 [Zingiber officinale]